MISWIERENCFIPVIAGKEKGESAMLQVEHLFIQKPSSHFAPVS